MEPQQPINVLWDRLGQAAPHEAASRAAVAYDPEQAVFRIPLLDAEHRVDPARRRVDAPEGAARFDATLVCVQYLLTARDEPPAGELVGPRSLPYGDFFFRGQHDMPTGKVEGAFGDAVDGFRAAAESLGGWPVEMADAAFQFRALPRVAVTIGFWAADDEFPARATFLLDRRADRQLPLDALWLLCGMLARRLVAAAPRTG